MELRKAKHMEIENVTEYQYWVTFFFFKISLLSFLNTKTQIMTKNVILKKTYPLPCSHVHHSILFTSSQYRPQQAESV